LVIRSKILALTKKPGSKLKRVNSSDFSARTDVYFRRGRKRTGETKESKTSGEEKRGLERLKKAKHQERLKKAKEQERKKEVRRD
jgi:hypothetical protein